MVVTVVTEEVLWVVVLEEAFNVDDVVIEETT
jgi:hypothetical protein